MDCKRNYIIFFIIILLVIFLICQRIGIKEYAKTYEYFDHKITLKIYENKNIFNDVDKILKKSDNSVNAVKKIQKYLKTKKIDKYIINDNGDITAGKHYKRDKFKISINYENDVLDIVEIKNESMVTRKDCTYKMIVIIGKDIVKTTKKAEEFCKSGNISKDYKVYWYDGNELHSR